MTADADPTQLRREADYYKKQVRELSGENMRLQYRVAGLQYQVQQKQRGFAFLLDLADGVGAKTELHQIYERIVRGINGTLSMDRTVVLLPEGDTGRYRAAHSAGYDAELAKTVAGRRVDLAELVGEEPTNLLVNAETERTPLVERIGEVFELPYFVVVPFEIEADVWAAILAGRVQEQRPLSPPLDNGDVETFRSIATFISALLRNMRVSVLEEMDRLKSDFFANISHEFRTPIALTLGPLEGMLAGRYGALPDTAHQPLNAAMRNQRRLLDLINQILDLAKFESGWMALKARPVRDVNQFVRDRVEAFRSLSEERGLELRIETDEALADDTAYLDREKFDKVLYNLLSNAHKFTKQGSITVATRRADGALRIQIRDTGQGIREDQLPHIFDRFRQAEGSESREFAGTGIGLSLVKEVVESHGGRVEVESTYGEGTSFELYVPLGAYHLSSDQIAGGEEEDDRPSSTQTPSMLGDEGSQAEMDGFSTESFNAKTEANLDSNRHTVLYVDDNEDLRRYVSELLQTRYNVYLAEDGRHGLEMAGRYHPDLILSDLMMPRLDGTGFCMEVKRTPELAATPFVLLTAKASLESKVEGLEEGADDYLSKPFSEVELMARVRNLLKVRDGQLRLKAELRSAREIQRSLLPPMVQSFGPTHIDALYRPCEELSGDFFDVIARPPWLYLYVADVTSHGTAAAQVTYLVQAMFRDVIARGGRRKNGEGGEAGGPPALSTIIDAAVDRFRGYAFDYAVGIQLIRLHMETGQVDYLRGNAPPGITVDEAGKVGILQSQPGPSLSGRLDERGQHLYPIATETLAPGTALYLFTDGAYEMSAGGRQFGLKRLSRLLGKADGQQGWKDQIVEELVEFNDGQASFPDDLTVVRVAREG